MLEYQQLTLALSSKANEMLIRTASTETPIGFSQKSRAFFQTRYWIMESDGNPVVFHMKQGFFKSSPVHVFDGYENHVGWFYPQALFHPLGLHWAQLIWKSPSNGVWETPNKSPLAHLIKEKKTLSIQFTNHKAPGPFARMILLGNALWQHWLDFP